MAMFNSFLYVYQRVSLGIEVYDALVAIDDVEDAKGLLVATWDCS